MKAASPPSAKAVAVRLLARREHAEAELRQKLAQREFGSEEIEQALDELKQGGWLSDARLCEAYVRMRAQRGYGPLRIRMELQQRGVDEALIEAALADPAHDWRQLLQAQYAKKYRGKPCANYNDKARRMRFLQYRGFSLEWIRDLLE